MTYHMMHELSIQGYIFTIKFLDCANKLAWRPWTHCLIMIWKLS